MPVLTGTCSHSIHDAAELRRFFRREMLRIQAESVCLHAPIFTTLDRTSDLADTVICTAYTLARDQVVSNPSARIARHMRRRTR